MDVVEEEVEDMGYEYEAIVEMVASFGIRNRHVVTPFRTPRNSLPPTEYTNHPKPADEDIGSEDEDADSDSEDDVVDDALVECVVEGDAVESKLIDEVAGLEVHDVNKCSVFPEASVAITHKSQRHGSSAARDAPKPRFVC